MTIGGVHGLAKSGVDTTKFQPKLYPEWVTPIPNKPGRTPMVTNHQSAKNHLST